MCGKELQSLNQLQLAGFRLHPGPLPEEYRGLAQVNAKRKHKHKKQKHHHRPESAPGASEGEPASSSIKGDEEREKKREKKHRKHDKDAEDRKRKKRDKKKKRKEGKE